MGAYKARPPLNYGSMLGGAPLTFPILKGRALPVIKMNPLRASTNIIKNLLTAILRG